MTICECGCNQAFEREAKKGRPWRFIPGHQFHSATAHAAREAMDNERRTKPPPDYPTHGLCLCGCGRKTTVSPVNIPSANRWKGYPRLYISGHNANAAQLPHAPKAERYVAKGYVYVLCPEHPAASVKGYIAEHRLNWEKANGRYLRSDEHVHHINGTRDDNHPENLEAMTRAEHAAEHRRLGTHIGTHSLEAIAKRTKTFHATIEKRRAAKAG